MNKLVEFLIQPILEQDQQNIALIPGGFKPPTAGHFYLANEVAKNPNIDKVIILIGHKVRDGVTKDESKAIWGMYKKYLPSNVEIQISDSSSPVSDVGSLIKNNPQNMYYPVVGIRGEMDLGDLKRYNSLEGKYTNYKPLIIKSEDTEERMSGTNTRAALIGGEKERFQSYLPTELSQDEKDSIWAILTQTPIEESEQLLEGFLSKIGGKAKNLISNFKAAYSDQKEDLKGFNQLAKKYLKKEELTDEEKSKLSRNFKDILKMSGIAVTFPVLGATGNALLGYLTNKVTGGKFTTLPTSFKDKLLNEMYAEPSKFSYPPMIKSLTEYMLDKGMNIRPLPKVKFVDNDTQNAQNFFGKTAYYDPNKRVIVLYTMGRHPKDIMRSFSHEMIHHMQNCDGRLGNVSTTDINEDDYLYKLEEEANKVGTMTFREWTDTLTKGPLNESDDPDVISYPSVFKSGVNITVVFKENSNYQDFKPYFEEHGYGFYYPEDKTIFLDGEAFINSNLNFNDLKFVEAHEITHLFLGHTGPYSKEDEMDADLGAYILLKKNGLPTEKLESEFKSRHGIDFSEELLDRVKDML
jgi:hypothetical protein